MILQQPVPPGPPPPPPFDPNLLLLNDGGPPPLVFLVVMIAALAAATIILWPLARAFARRLEGKAGNDAALRAEVDQMHTRLGEVESLHARVLELEERVDFTERLLAQAQQPARLDARTEGSGR